MRVPQNTHALDRTFVSVAAPEKLVSHRVVHLWEQGAVEVHVLGGARYVRAEVASSSVERNGTLGIFSASGNSSRKTRQTVATFIYDF